MNTWATIWAGVILAALSAFACLSLVVTIGGFRDLVMLLKRESRRTKQGRKMPRK